MDQAFVTVFTSSFEASPNTRFGLDPEAYIYEGFWRNLSKHSTRNLTLTLCPTYSVILTNALALFVAMSGGQLWTIIRFTIHQIRATTRPEAMNRTHNLQQVVLRNATTDISTARLMLYLAWSCRIGARGAIATCMTIMLLALFNAAFFMVAGTLSNNLVNAGATVLSRSPFCGYWNPDYLDVASFGNQPASLQTLSLSTEYIVTDSEEVQLNMEYARACYMNEPSSYWDSSCSIFEKPRLNWTTHLDAACPFSAEACSHDARVITFDTGHINSHIDLGINAKAEDRLTYRRVTHCTVLNDTEFTTFSSQSNIAGTDLSLDVSYANYGESIIRETDFTYSYSNFADFYTNFSGQGTTPFQVGTTIAYGEIADRDQQSNSTFQPVSQLAVADADVELLFLGYTGKYTQPVDDPWFSAHKVKEDLTSSVELIQRLYAPDRQISTVGCTEQHQICTYSSGCSTLSGFDQVQADMRANMKMSGSQNITLDRIIRSVTRSSLWYVVQEIAKTSSPVLAIDNSASGSFSLTLKLPDHQWQLELDRWHSISMARLQRTVVELATGQIAAQAKYLVPPQTRSEKWLCQNQRINSTVFQSFNVVSLIIVLIFGILIITTSLNIERLSAWVQRRWNIGGSGRDMWLDHDMLGKQRWRAMFATPQGSTYGTSPTVHIHSPYPHASIQVNNPTFHMQSPQRNMELAYLQTNFPDFGTHHPMNPSPKRASSQALSPGDSARTFPGHSGKSSSPQLSASPARSARSAITADFCFDLGPPRHSPSPPCTGYPAEKQMEEKPLPQPPVEEKAFVIDHGIQPSAGADITDEKRVEELGEKEMTAIEPAVGSGPGRWAYYSAHKRRYGPRLAVPVLPSHNPPHMMTSNAGGLRGSFIPGREGNWI